jgi:perosamine synthetase
MRTIARYGVRSVPGDEKEIVAAFRRGEAIDGPAIFEYEARFAEYHKTQHAIATSYGRMAFYYILRALELPAGSEVIFPALTFWVVPEIARRAGLRPVFVDVDPATFNIDPSKIEESITERTRAIVPTHLYGQPCEMDRITRLAEKYHLYIVEDCAQAVGARYRGRRVGTLGHAAFFSFQLLKGINTYGGGMAVTNDAELADRIRTFAMSEPSQSAGELARRFASGYAARCAVSPTGFSCWGWPLQAAASFLGHYDLSRYVWEKIRPLDPFPASYRRRYSNAQAIIGIRALEKLDEFNARSRNHAIRYSSGLTNCRTVRTPPFRPDVEHVYYQYCIYVSDAARASRRAIRQGVDFETTHVDICSALELFAESNPARCTGAEQTEKALQLPVYSRLRDSDVERVLGVVKEVTADLSPVGETESTRRNTHHAVVG